MILCFGLAAWLLAWQVGAEQRWLAVAVTVLLALPVFMVWGAYVGMSRRITAGGPDLLRRVEELEQARRDIDWALRAMHNRSEEHWPRTDNLDRWCADLANRISHLENVGSQLQASEAAQASLLEALRAHLLGVAKIVEGNSVSPPQAELAKLAGRVGLLEDAALAQAVNTENQLRSGSKAGAEL